MQHFNNKQLLFRLFPLFLIVYEFCTNMSNDMYLPALALIASDLGTKINLVQLTITAWLAGNTAVQLIIGPLSDRYGRRPILFGGGFLFLLSTLGCALAPSLALLIFFRFLQGIGVCTMMVSGYASIHDLYNDKKAIHILVWMGTAAVLAPAIGPVLGGVLLLVTDWRVIFLSLFALGGHFIDRALVLHARKHVPAKPTTPENENAYCHIPKDFYQSSICDFVDCVWIAVWRNDGLDYHLSIYSNQHLKDVTC